MQSKNQDFFPSGSAAFIHQARAVDAAVGDAAGTHQHAVAGPTGEVAPAANATVILAFRAPELQTQPKARSKVRRAQVADGRHLVGAAEEDLHAHLEANLSVRGGGGASRNSTATAAEAAPAATVRIGATPGDRASPARLLWSGDGR